MDIKPAKPNDYIYIYCIRGESVHYDRSVSRTGLGPPRAKQRVKELNDLGYEAFFTIGVTVPGAFY